MTERTMTEPSFPIVSHALAVGIDAPVCLADLSRPAATEPTGLAGSSSADLSRPAATEPTGLAGSSSADLSRPAATERSARESRVTVRNFSVAMPTRQ